MCMQQIRLLIHILPIDYVTVYSLDIVCSVPFRKKSFGLVVISGNNPFREAWQISIDPKQMWKHRGFLAKPD